VETFSKLRPDARPQGALAFARGFARGKFRLGGSQFYLEFGFLRVVVLVCRRVGAGVLGCSVECRPLRFDGLCDKMGGCCFGSRLRLFFRGASRGLFLKKGFPGLASFLTSSIELGS
jgi:hypothetical protein